MKTLLLTRGDKKFIKLAASGERIALMERQAGELVLRGYLLPPDKAAAPAPKPAKPKAKAKPARKPAAKRKAAPKDKAKAPAKKAGSGGFAERMAKARAAAAKLRK